VSVFVTGATGFVTGNVARRLIARGDEVRALVRDPAQARGLAGAQRVRATSQARTRCAWAWTVWMR